MRKSQSCERNGAFRLVVEYHSHARVRPHYPATPKEEAVMRILSR